MKEYVIYSSNRQAYYDGFSWTSWGKQAKSWLSQKEAEKVIENLGFINTTKADIVNGAYVCELVS